MRNSSWRPSACPATTIVPSARVSPGPAGWPAASVMNESFMTSDEVNESFMTSDGSGPAKSTAVIRPMALRPALWTTGPSNSHFTAGPADSEHWAWVSSRPAT